MSIEKTIYDIIPTIEKELIKLLETFLKADSGAFHLWEMTVFIPGCNAFIHNMSGVNEALHSDNYISAITNFRSAMESLAA